MERLLRDGGDLDSMDRSLLDYNPAASGASRAVSAVPENSKVSMNNGSITSPTSPPPLSGAGLTASSNGGMAAECATSPMSYRSAASESAGQHDDMAMQILKKDMVVRFDEERTSVKSALASGGGVNGSGGQQQHHHCEGGVGAPAVLPLSPNDNPAYGSPFKNPEDNVTCRGESGNHICRRRLLHGLRAFLV
jgi:hypothetical protein